MGQKKQTPPFQDMGQIYFHVAEFFGPSGRTPFRGPGNTGSVASRTKIRPNNSKQPEFQTSGPRKIWAEFLAEFLISQNIGRINKVQS